MANPVQYAEDALGVHQVYETAMALQSQFQDLTDTLNNLRNIKRDQEMDLQVTEADVTLQVMNDTMGESLAARERAIKTALAESDDVQNKKQQVRVTTDLIAENESNRAAIKLRVESLNARMIQLGGYLQYLAAAKLASTTRRDPSAESA